MYGDYSSDEYTSSEEDDQPYCSQCRRYFSSENALEQHNQIHRPRNIACYGDCGRNFMKYGDMIDHLEQGCWNSDITESDLMVSAGMMYQWKKYIDEDMISQVRRGELGGKPYKCPECGNWFGKLSAMFKHAFATGCEDHRILGKLRYWLGKRHG